MRRRARARPRRRRGRRGRRRTWPRRGRWRRGRACRRRRPGSPAARRGPGGRARRRARRRGRSPRRSRSGGRGCRAGRRARARSISHACLATPLKSTRSGSAPEASATASSPPEHDVGARARLHQRAHDGPGRARLDGVRDEVGRAVEAVGQRARLGLDGVEIVHVGRGPDRPGTEDLGERRPSKHSSSLVARQHRLPRYRAARVRSTPSDARIVIDGVPHRDAGRERVGTRGAGCVMLPACW